MVGAAGISTGSPGHLIHRQTRKFNPITILQPPVPIHAPIAQANGAGTRGERNREGMGMIEPQDRLARERQEIAIRVANFRATQRKFQQEREEYCEATLENARNGSDARTRWS
jgi:hypothetical protein